jgi:hypothetical protein
VLLGSSCPSAKSVPVLADRFIRGFSDERMASRSPSASPGPAGPSSFHLARIQGLLICVLGILRDQVCKVVGRIAATSGRILRKAVAPARGKPAGFTGGLLAADRELPRLDDKLYLEAYRGPAPISADSDDIDWPF